MELQRSDQFRPLLYCGCLPKTAAGRLSREAAPGWPHLRSV